jgi:hypothetical protein
MVFLSSIILSALLFIPVTAFSQNSPTDALTRTENKIEIVLDLSADREPSGECAVFANCTEAEFNEMRAEVEGQLHEAEISKPRDISHDPKAQVYHELISERDFYKSQINEINPQSD